VKRTLTAYLGLCCSLGCSGESLTQGLEEPIQVQNAQFMRGELPGSRPADEPKAPNPTSLASIGRTVEQGSSGINVVGRASPDSESIAVQLVGGGGAGYWVLPVGTPEPQFNDEPAFAFSVAFAREIAGMQRLRVAAIDAHGDSGTQSDLEICVAPRVPDNLNACVPTIAPPELVVSLSWDRAADLDLVVVTPSGKIVSPKDPSTATVIRVKNDEAVMTDGPFVEGKEHIGGFSVIKAPDLDAALEVGRRLAQITTLPIEVRPFQGEVP
jgi:hypothetical protein